MNPMSHKPMAHLHVHTQYSLLDGASKFDKLFRTLRTKGVSACSITDHGNLFGAVEFFEAANKAGIQPIIGCEAYLAPLTRFDKTKSLPGFEKDYHLILLAKDAKGWKNLCKMITKAYLEGYYAKPRIDRELLELHHEGLVCLSACMQGEIPYLLRNDRENEALMALEYYASLFKEDFFVEVQANGLKEQYALNGQLMGLAKRFGVGLVATNDCHYVAPEDAKAQDVLLCIQTNRKVWEEDRFKFPTEGLYVKSAVEMLEEIGLQYEEAVANTLEIASRCNFAFDFAKKRFPVYRLKEGENGANAQDLLRIKAKRGLEEKLLHLDPSKRFEYEKRLEQELDILISKGFADYFLIVQDFTNHARSHGVIVGPGRGSAAGSLVSYALGITKIDPIQHGLLFERFLNPERVSLPDIDVDFCYENRERVLEYVKERYGRENVSQIITFGTLKAKAAIRDVGRVLGLSFAETDRIAKLIPAPRQGREWPLEEALKMEPKLSELAEKDPRIKELLGYALVLEDQVRHASTHAAGVVISGEPLDDYVPLFKLPDGNVTTQFSMKYVEKLGYIKFDFLGLKTLTLLDTAKGLIQKARGIQLDLDDLPLDCPEVYALLAKGDTTGVFQLESQGMRDLLIRLKPGIFEDLVAVLALFRPGPLGSGMVDDFIERKHGLKEVDYPLPELENILKETYGVILYQEQVMQIASRLADYSLGEADLLRRAMGKKDPKEMARQKERFLSGTTKKRVDASKAQDIFALMEKFADYGFNKSHSAAYAYISYQCAYVKANFPKEWMAAILSIDMGDMDKILKDIYACKEMGIAVLPPHVNSSDTSFTVTEEGIRFGFLAIKNVGEKAVHQILQERKANGPFKDLAEFVLRVASSLVNKRVIESLIKSGALDSLGPSRKAMFERVDTLLTKANKRATKRPPRDLFGGFGVSDLHAVNENAYQDHSEWPDEEKLAFERETTGFYLSGHPLKPYWEKLLRLYGGKVVPIETMDPSSEPWVGGVVTALSVKTTKKGDKYANVVLEDLLTTYAVLVWPDTFRRYDGLLQKGKKLVLRGYIDNQGQGSRKLVAKEVYDLEEHLLELVSRYGVTLVRLNTERITKEALFRLKELFFSTPGSSPVLLFFESGDLRRTLKPEGGLRVDPKALKAKLSGGFGGTVKVVEG